MITPLSGVGNDGENVKVESAALDNLPGAHNDNNFPIHCQAIYR